MPETDLIFDELIPQELEILRQYCTNPEGDIFCVVNLAGCAGATFARYSRARGSWKKTTLKEFIQEGRINSAKADELIARVLVAYGDDSVGELEGVHLSLENISNLATKEIEDRRIGGSPIEQSSRYVVYDQRDKYGRFRYLRVPEIMQTGLARDFEQTMDFIFESYCKVVRIFAEDFLPKLKPIGDAEYDIDGTGKKKLSDFQDEKKIKAFKQTYRIDLKTKSCDTARILLPACTLTNVGLFGVGRFYQHMLSHLYSHELKEMHSIATRSHNELNKVIKQYVKRAQRNEYFVEIDDKMFDLTDRLFIDPEINEEPSVVLLENDPADFFKNLIAQMLYKYSELPLRQLRKSLEELTDYEIDAIEKAYTGNRKSRRDRPGRALEFGYPLHFDLIGDFGIYRDLQRHRMLTQERQLLSTRLGFNMPDLLIEAGCRDLVDKCVHKSEVLYEKIRPVFGREVAQYVVLFGHNIRWTMGMNFREAMHLLELRTIPQGHPSYRKMCQEMHRQIKQKYHDLADLMKFVDYNDYFWSRAESEAVQRRKENKLGITEP